MSFLNDLNLKQREAVRTVEGPVMVVAGAGSGKTRVLTYRIAYLLSIGVPSYQILALTFTNKAANEMKARIAALVGEKSKQLWMGTFHSMLARLLRMECEKIGYEKNFSIYDTLESLGLIKGIMNSRGMPFQQFNANAIRSRISSAKNQMVSVDEYTKQAVDLFQEKTAQVYADYQIRLKRNNAMDFDDLLLKPIELFNGHKSILQKYQDRFRFILVDEYQDTNRAQYVLLNLLAAKHANICVVGDDAQSIYGFRGADIRNILDFRNDYPQAKVFYLEQNYRSTKSILAVADRLIKNNVDQLTKTLWTENDGGDPVTLMHCEDDRDEGLQIVARIADESFRLKLDFKDFAILYRTNAQSRALEDALRRKSIPYVIVGGVEFYQRKEIKDVLAYYKVLVNPKDEESFLRIINYPNRGIGDVAIERLRKFAQEKNASLLEAAGHANHIEGLPRKAKEGMKWLASYFGKYRSLKGIISLSELSRTMVDDLGILTLFKEEGTSEAIVRWENIQELVSAVSEFASLRPDSTLEEFLEDVSLVSDVDQWDDKHNAVTLMTLHSAKGLEFPVIFLSGVEEGLLPFYNSVIDRKELEEERRLFYVGITRSMKKLYLSCTSVRYRFGDATHMTPSRFIDEIGREHLMVSALRPGREGTRSRGESFSWRPRVKAREPERPTQEHFADEIPDYDNHFDEVKNVRIGGFVFHDVFGKGRIMSLSGQGEMTKAVVEFDQVGKKNLMLKYARLKIVQ